jgi:23S rRNA (adenine2030-N6)-methyltransferase
MNYRHAFHAGNHADVLKHIVLARVIEYFKTKDKPFAFLDAHAGLGAYDLEGIQAIKTGEWQGGIGKMAELFAPDVETLLAPYRAVIAAMNASGGMRYYPGSPELALRLLRPVDRMIVNELHPVDVEILRENYKHDKRVRVTSLDAVQSVKAELPFAQKRGLVLIDPPFEVLNENERVAQAIQFAHRRFATGTFLIWYPVTTEEFTEKFLATMKDLALPNMFKIELRVKAAFESGGLAGSGVIIINPPWTLEAELKVLLPALATRLGLVTWGRGQVEWVTPPQ